MYSLHKLVHDVGETLLCEVRVQHRLLPLLANVLDVPKTRRHVDDPILYRYSTIVEVHLCELNTVATTLLMFEDNNQL